MRVESLSGPVPARAGRPDRTPLDAGAATARGALSANTERAVRSDLDIYAAWCAACGVSAVPATAATIAAFVDAMARVRAPSTVRRYVASIAGARAAHVRRWDGRPRGTLVPGFAALSPVGEPGEEHPEVVLRAFADQECIARQAAGLVNQGRGGRPVNIVEHGFVQRCQDALECVVATHGDVFLQS